MEFKDYYKILGIQNNKVTLEEIKNSYREMAKLYHPDMNIGDSKAEERFKDINEAYRVLANEKTRIRYDFTYLHNRRKVENRDIEKENKTFKENIFEIFFGEKSTINKVKSYYGKNITTSINITIKEAFFGTSKEIVYKEINGKEIKTILKIPAGIQRGATIRVPEKGNTGKDGGKNGDLYVEININDDKKYKLEGIDIYYDLNLDYTELLLGTKKTIQLFDESIIIEIPECTNSEKKITIKGKGYKIGENRGNLYVITHLYFEKKINDAQKNMIKKAKQIM